jgi:hypothetical protein
VRRKNSKWTVSIIGRNDKQIICKDSEVSFLFIHVGVLFLIIFFKNRSIMWFGNLGF